MPGMEKELLDALQFDLGQEYGLAVRYLIWSNTLKDMKRPEIAAILTGLAADSVTHSEFIRDILKENGVNPPEALKYYKSEFKDIKMALRSCFYLENRMAKEYSELAADIGAGGEHYETFVQLANWETVHMYNVLDAIKLAENLETPAGVDTARQDLIKRMRELGDKIPVMEGGERARLLMPEDTPESRARFESTLTEALEKARALGRSIAGTSRIGESDTKKRPLGPKLEATDEELSDLGTPAEEVMEQDVVRVIFRENKSYEAYCFRCSEKHTIKDPQKVVLAGEKPAIKGLCPHCGASMFTLEV